MNRYSNLLAIVVLLSITTLMVTLFSSGKTASAFNARQVDSTGKITLTIPVQNGSISEVISNNIIAKNHASGDGDLYSKDGLSSTINPLLGVIIFLPFVIKALPSLGIHGTVTDDGQPANGVPLDLRFYDGTNWSTIASQTTASNGIYSFLNIPGLNPGQLYYVRYQHQEGYNSRIWTWHTKSIDTYESGSHYNIGDFDVRDVFLLLPMPDTTISLPFPFQWTLRPNSPTDTYEFDLYDPNDGDPYFYTNPSLGYVTSYTLNNRPPGFNTGELYVWEIWVYSPDGGYGISLETRMVTFANKSMGSQPGETLPALKDIQDLESR